MPPIGITPARQDEIDRATQEALSRNREAAASVLRGVAAQQPQGADAHLRRASELDQEGAEIARTLADAGPAGQPDPEGTAPTLADKSGNFAASRDVANAGGIGVVSSNTNVATGEPARSPDEAGTIDPAVRNDAALAGFGGTAATGEAIDIPETWRDLSWPQRRSLASRLAPNEAINTGEDAERVIAAEQDRRVKA